jgi:polyisoprenoid-binding protein YceI
MRSIITITKYIIMKQIILLAFIALSFQTLKAQQYMDRSAYVGFFSETKMENIKADNNKGTLVYDAATGSIQMSALMKAFEFEKALMQEHFNENYVESDKFPKAVFKGKVENHTSINLSKDGTYNVKVTGEMSMHGVTKKITTDAVFKVSGGKITCESKFNVKPEDYNITIPNTVRDNIASAIAITVKANLEVLKK